MSLTLLTIGAIAAHMNKGKNQDVIGYAPPEVDAPALRPFRPDGRVLKSELAGISNEAWTDFVFTMKAAPLDAISPSNGLGMFDMRYKRLADFGLVTNVRYKRDVVTNRSVQVADWVAPLTQEQFLKSASAQYGVFAKSMADYFGAMLEGVIKLPDTVTASGALAILHRGGRNALAQWHEQQFEATRELFNRANGVF